MPTIKVEHRDKLGRLLKVGDCVAYPNSNSLGIGKVKKLNPKMVKVFRIGATSRYYTGSNKYPNDLILLDGPEVTMYIIKNS